MIMTRFFVPILTEENLLPIMVQTHLDFGALNVLPFPYEGTQLALTLFVSPDKTQIKSPGLAPVTAAQFSKSF